MVPKGIKLVPKGFKWVKKGNKLVPKVDDPKEISSETDSKNGITDVTYDLRNLKIPKPKTTLNVTDMSIHFKKQECQLTGSFKLNTSDQIKELEVELVVNNQVVLIVQPVRVDQSNKYRFTQSHVRKYAQKEIAYRVSTKNAESQISQSVKIDLPISYQSSVQLVQINDTPVSKLPNSLKPSSAFPDGTKFTFQIQGKDIQKVLTHVQKIGTDYSFIAYLKLKLVSYFPKLSNYKWFNSVKRHQIEVKKGEIYQVNLQPFQQGKYQPKFIVIHSNQEKETLLPEKNQIEVKQDLDTLKIAKVLFNLQSHNDYQIEQTYQYSGPNPEPACNYKGGHSGIHFKQIKDPNASFYSVSKGKVTTIGVGKKDNRIGVYDSEKNITVFYLHANDVLVKVGDTIEIGKLLGTQGKTGNTLGFDEYIHIEIREGRQTLISNNFAQSKEPISILKDYLKDYNPQSHSNLKKPTKPSLSGLSGRTLTFATTSGKSYECTTHGTSATAAQITNCSSGSYSFGDDAIASGKLCVRVKASGSTPASDWACYAQAISSVKPQAPTKKTTIIYENNNLTGISNAINVNNKVVIGFSEAMGTMSSYPDNTIWSKLYLLNGSQKITVDDSYSESAVSYSIVKTNDNKVALAYQKPTGSGYGFDAPFKIFDGSSQTKNEKIFSNANWGFGTSIDIDSQGKIYVIQFGHAGYFLNYSTNQSGSWVNSNISGYSTYYHYPKLTVDNNDKPHIITSQLSGSYGTKGKMQHWYKNGGSWSQETIATDSKDHSRLIFDGSNNIYAVYIDENNVLKLVSKTGANWQSEVIATGLSFTGSYLTNIAIFNNIAKPIRNNNN